MKSILITGGAGFIGSNLAEYFVKKGIFVRIIDNLSTGNYNNIKELLNKYDNIEFVKGDITDINTCKEVVKGIDVISHQAALGSVPRSVNDPLKSNYNNVNGTLNMLWAAKEEGIKRFVYASSSSVYGDNNTLPKVENETGKPLSPYAVTKCVSELYGNVFTNLYNMECIGLRYFNVFGPKQDPNGQYAAVIPKFINLMKQGKSPVINGDGSFSRDFTYIDNIISANEKALFTKFNNNEAFGQAYNIGAGGRVTILELFNVINNSLNANLKPIFGKKRDGDIPHSNASIEKAFETFKYKPLVDFETGISNTINYMVNNN